MKSAEATPRYRELPVVFPVGRNSLCGIFNEPARVREGGAAVVLLTGGGYIPMCHRNRMWVHLARRLAETGFPVLRFDYHGAGESTGGNEEGETPDVDLDRPFADDLEAAVCWLRERHLSRLVLVGTCFGARTILAAGERFPELKAAVLLSTPLRGNRLYEGAAMRFAQTLPLREYVRMGLRRRVLVRMREPQWRERYWRIAKVKLQTVVARRTGSGHGEGDPEFRWISSRFLEPVRRLGRGRVRLLFVYGLNDQYYEEFQTALAGELGRIVRDPSASLEVRTVSGVLQGLTTLEIQRAAMDSICEILVGVCTGASAGVNAIVPSATST